MSTPPNLASITSRRSPLLHSSVDWNINAMLYGVLMFTWMRLSRNICRSIRLSSISTLVVLAALGAVPSGALRIAVAAAAIPSPSVMDEGVSPDLKSDATLNVMGDLETAVIAEINRLRTDPARYAAWLETQRQYYDSFRDSFHRPATPSEPGTVVRLPGEPAVQTVEGEVALDEAIALLQTLEPLPPLQASVGLGHATQDHLQDVLGRGVLTTTGRDGSRPGDRAARYGTLEGQAVELLSYGN